MRLNAFFIQKCMQKFTVKFKFLRRIALCVPAGLTYDHGIPDELHFRAIRVGVSPVGGGRREFAFDVNAANPGMVDFQNVGIGKMPCFCA